MCPLRTVDPTVVPRSLDLLSLPFAFTQRRLLTDSYFIEEAKKRGYDLNRDILEWLHRRGVVVPLFRLYSRSVEPQVEWQPGYRISMNLSYLYEAAAEGRLRDPAQTPYRPWPTRRSDIGLCYSWFQLLSLRRAQPIITQLLSSAYRMDDYPDGGLRIGYYLPRISSAVRSSALRSRALAIILEVLSPRYTPRVLGRVMHDLGNDNDQMMNYLQTDPKLERSLLSEIPPNVLREQAERWLSTARHFDPLGDWYQVVRLSDWRHWEYLRLDALDTMEMRFAAEMLLYYYDDLAAAGSAEPLSPLPESFSHPRADRLKVNYPERAKTLQRFRLVNAPAVVVAVEGHTEMEILPRILELSQAGPSTGLVAFVNLKSVDANVKLVARSVAVPVLLPERPGRATVLRPLVGLVIVVDQESNYSSPERIEQQKQTIINEILESLSQELRTDTLRSQLEQLVIVTTWGDGGCFEYAHFTDSELAQAIVSIATTLPDDISNKFPPYEEIETQLARQRTLGKDIKNVWKPWGYKISKPKLADTLWPTLHAKLTSDERSSLPVAQVADSIIDLAVNLRPVGAMRTS